MGAAMTPSRRTRSTVAAFLVAAFALAGCATSAETPDNGTVSGTIQLSYWGSSSRVAKYNEINRLFEQQHPGTAVQASATDFNSYLDKLNVRAASRTMPCVTTIQTRQLNDYTGNGILMDLEPLVRSGQIDVSQIPGSVLDTGRGPDGKLYMIPFGVAWNATVMNTTVARQYSIAPLPAGYTWEQYEAWLKDAAAKLPPGIHAVNDQGQREPVFSAYVVSHGYTMFGSDGQIAFPRSVLADYWNMWQRYSKAGYTSSPQQNADEPAQPEQFYVTRGKLLSEDIAGNALPAVQAGNKEAVYSTVAFPSGSAGLGNMFFVSGYSIPQTCRNVTTAAGYIDFWTNNDDAARIFASDNGAVANTRQLDQQLQNPTSPEVKLVLQQYSDIVAQKVPTQILPAGYSSMFEQSFQRDYQDIAFGRKTVDEAVDSFYAEAADALGTG
jgi:multiple sugar transport system substrate-binding protein